MQDQTEISPTPSIDKSRILDIYEPLLGDIAINETDRMIPGNSVGDSTLISTLLEMATQFLIRTKTQQEQEPITLQPDGSLISCIRAKAKTVKAVGSQGLSRAKEDKSSLLSQVVRIPGTVMSTHSTPEEILDLTSFHRQGRSHCRTDLQDGCSAVEYNMAQVEPANNETILDVPSPGNGQRLTIHESTSTIGRSGSDIPTSSFRARYQNIAYDAGSTSPAITEQDTGKVKKDREICKLFVIMLFALLGLSFGGRLIAQTLELRVSKYKEQLASDDINFSETDTTERKNMLHSYNSSMLPTVPNTSETWIENSGHNSGENSLTVVLIAENTLNRGQSAKERTMAQLNRNETFMTTYNTRYSGDNAPVIANGGTLRVQPFSPNKFVTVPTTVKQTTASVTTSSHREETNYIAAGIVIITVSLCLIIYVIYSACRYITAGSEDCARIFCRDGAAITDRLE